MISKTYETLILGLVKLMNNESYDWLNLQNYQPHWQVNLVEVKKSYE